MKKLVFFFALAVGVVALFAQNTVLSHSAAATAAQTMKIDDAGSFTPSNDSKANIIMLHNQCPPKNVIGQAVPTILQAGIRFDVTQLAALGVNGGKLVNFTFIPWHATVTTWSHTYTIVVYKGGSWGDSPNSGTEVYRQDVPLAGLVRNVPKKVIFDAPLLLDKFQELWITLLATPIEGWVANGGNPYPHIADGKYPETSDCPVIDGYSNIWASGGSSNWGTVNVTFPEGTASTNWLLKAEVEPGEDINCAPAENLIVKHLTTTGNNEIKYDCPGQQNTLLAQCGQPSGYVVNFGGLTDYGAYHRFDATDLAAVNGREFRKFSFSATYASTQDGYQNSYTAQVFQGGNWHADDPAERYEGQKLHEKHWPVEELQRTMILVLDPPLVIDQTKEIWAGCFIEPIEEGVPYAFQYDDGPLLDGKGNLLCIDGEWLTWFETSDGERLTNWIFSCEVYTPPNATVNIYKADGGDGILLKENHLDFYNKYIHTGGTIDDCYFVKLVCQSPQTGLAPPTPTVCAVSDAGVKENTATKFSIVPNPTRNNMTITATNDFTSYEIVNFLGQVVISERNNSNTATVNVSNLNNGVYFVRLFNNSGKPAVQKFVKN